MNKRTLILPLVAFFLLAGLASAASGPQYRSLRGLSMGNAFVAVVDDKDALYYNPAGLNLINALGNPSKRPGLANYPRNRFNARVNPLGSALPIADGLEMMRFYNRNSNAFKNGDSLRANSRWLDDLTPFDQRAIELGLMHSVEFAMHNFGAAVWMDESVAPYADEGLLLPQAGFERIQIDLAIQAAMARGFLNNRLAAGAGYKIANRQTVGDFRVAATQFADKGDRDDLIDDVQDTISEKFGNLTDVGSYGHGIDLGVLWQQTSWLRLGASMQNMGMYLNHEFVTPELTVGAAVTAPILSTGGYFARKVNFAVDFEDLLNDERNYRFLSKVNFGTEVEQHFWWFAALRVSGGFKGGYWAAGTGLSILEWVHIEYATWAEEAGYYTGQVEDRYHAFRLGIGL